jgi:hypothetical protein
MKRNRFAAIMAIITGFAGALVPCAAFGGAIVRSATGPSPASIQAAVDQFRTDLGGANNGVGGTSATGRREINWDGAPDAVSAPNNLPANFFNANSPRGAVFSTPGTAFQLSAKTGNPSLTPVLFGNINPTYPNTFQAFSPERLFAAIGSNITETTFFVPGTTARASVSGFGAVFTDVDSATSTTIQFFDLAGFSLGTFAVPASLPGSQSLSFLGVSFNGTERVARVRITSGNTVLGPDDNPPGADVVAMDDFIYGEPQASASGCAGDAFTLCLDGGSSGRFKVTVAARAPSQNAAQPSAAVGITPESGAFWFFTPANLDLLIKVIDGRTVNGKFWVFIGAASNLEYTVTVTDTVGGATRTYVNAQGNFAAIADIQAF